MGEEGPNTNPIRNILSDFSFIKGNFLIILMGWLIVDFTREMANTYYPLYVVELGGTATTIGIIAAAATITDAIVKIPGGHLADKYRRKRLILVMTFLASGAHLFYALAPSWHFLVLAAVLTSFCWIYTPAFNSIVIEALPKEKRGTGYSLVNLITRVSTTPSPLIAGFLFTRYGVVGASRFAYGLVSVAFLIAGILRFRLEEETDKPEVTAKAVFSSLSSAKEFSEGINVWKEMPKSLTALFSMELLYLLPNIMFNTIMTLYLVNDLGINELQLSRLGAIIGVTMIIFARAPRKIIDKYGRVRPILICFLLIMVTIPVLLLDVTFTQIVLVTPIIGLVNVVYYSSTQALWADLIPEDKRGRILGSQNFFGLIVVAIGSVAGGLLYDQVSHQLPILIYWFINLPCFIITWLYIKEPDKSEEVMED
jgi:MFS family permease